MKDHTTAEIFEELWKRIEFDANVSEELASESNELQERIDKAIESLNYYIEGMNESLEIWNKVRENEKIETDTLLQMLEREKQNYIDVLNILKGIDKE